MSYTIKREVFRDHGAIVFEWRDRQSEQELLHDFTQLKRLPKHAWRHRRLSGVAWYYRLRSGLRLGASDH